MRLLRILGIITAVIAITAPAAQAEQPGRQLLFYNHSWGTLDRVTADAIEHSAYLKDFASFEVRTTTGSGGETWTGRYLRGRETYLELFGVGDVSGQDGELGSAGLGLSTEHDGDYETIVQRLKENGVPKPIEFLQTRDFGDHKPVPWFDAVFTADTYDRFGAWAMEYRPEYLADPRSKVEPARFPGDVGRERYLNNEYRNHLMRDITAVRIAVTAKDLAATVPLLKSGGYRVTDCPGGVVVNDGLTEIRFDSVPLGQTGLKKVEFALNKPAARHEERIGNSTLTVGPGPRATWIF
ncbi:hypothetical protein D5S17_19505 [Pseudonocardiaceae bacterium YIM PH 21723]|nr:hypothetical protein D5S17_19505 [Pseudonocardiaceae bacterium YIM PH 21723]